MIKVKLFMKSGNTVEFGCESIDFKVIGNAITGYTIEKHDHRRLWIDTTQIEAVFLD